MASRSESFFPASGCVPEQGEWISQCAAIWIRGIKMNVTGEHTHYVSVSHVHFYSEKDNMRQILLFFPVPHSIFIYIASVRGLGVSEQSSSCAVRLFIKVIIAAINEDPACHHTALGIV